MSILWEFIVHILFELIFGWIGCMTVRLISFGKWHLDLEDPSECMIAISVGIVVVAALVFAGFFLVSPVLQTA